MATARITLELTYNWPHEMHPRDWDWCDLLGMAPAPADDGVIGLRSYECEEEGEEAP